MAQIETLRTRMSQFRFPWKKQAPSAILKIPTHVESSTDFIGRAAALLKDSKTRVYIDTSFLMWLTKIGADSRSEFFKWLIATCPDRVCVPVWSAHEYIRHHVSGTILDELETRLKEIGEIVGKTYTYLRPFLDAPLNEGVIKPESQQAAARNALNELDQLHQNAKKWKSLYKVHSNEVIEFINQMVPSRTDVFKMLDGIEALGSDRFEGRVPPGFQDRNKKAKTSISSVAGDPEEIVIGSNRVGDLIFWKEVLKHASTEKARNVILLTNDQKNDWQLGGREPPNEEALKQLKRKLRPLPLAHPMLCLEANLEAQIEHVMLLDSVYLGFFLKEHGGEGTKSFVDVAIVPDPPNIPTESERRKEITKSYKNEPVKLNTKLFADNDSLKDTVAALARGWIYSKQPMLAGSNVQLLFSTMQQAFANGQSISEFVTEANFATFDNTMIVSLGRNLHDECIAGGTGNTEAVTDLLNLLEKLPPITAACIYLGFIGSMYFDRLTNSPRLPPSSPVDQLIFDCQTAPFADKPIHVINDIFKKRNKPLYILNVEAPLIDVTLDHVPDADGEVILGSIKVSGLELFSKAQKNADLNFRTIFGGKEILLAQDILQVVSSRFVIPLKQMSYIADPEAAFQITPTAGFKIPKTIYIDPT